MSLVIDIAPAEGVTTKCVMRACRANAIAVANVNTDNLSGPNTTTVTNAIRATEKQGRPKDRRH